MCARSTLPPTREDDADKRGPGRPQGEFRTSQEAARHRLTVRRACGQPSESSPTVWRPVYSDISLRNDQRGFGAARAQVDPQERHAECRQPRMEDASLRAEAASHGARVRIAKTLLLSVYHLDDSNVHPPYRRHPDSEAYGLRSGSTATPLTKPSIFDHSLSGSFLLAPVNTPEGSGLGRTGNGVYDSVVWGLVSSVGGTPGSMFSGPVLSRAFYLVPRWFSRLASQTL